VHPLLVRADSAGSTHGFVRGLIEANCDFSIGHPVNAQVRAALLLAQEEEWDPAVELDGTPRPGAWVIELTALLDPSSFGVGTRLICRRERPHPGAQKLLCQANCRRNHPHDLACVPLRRVDAGAAGAAGVITMLGHLPE